MAFYPSEMFKDLASADHLKCSIGLGIVKDPIRDECGHIFCLECFTKHYKETPICPITQAAIPDTAVAAGQEKIEVQTLECLCIHLGECQWDGNLEIMKAHLENECPAEEVKCPEKNCGDKIKRSEVQHHLTECDWVIKKCEFCDFNSNDLDMEEHHNNDCQEIKIDCDRGGLHRYQRKHEMIHLKYGCEKVKFECFFRNAGCFYTGTMDDMGEHMSDAMILHASFLEQKLAHFEKYQEVTNRMLEIIKDDPQKFPELKKFPKEIADLEEINYRNFKGEFHKEFSNKDLIFTKDDLTVTSKEPGKNQLLFIEKQIHESHKLVFRIDEYNPKGESLLSFGFTKKSLLYQRGTTKYEEKIKHRFYLMNDGLNGGLGNISMPFKEKEEYMVSFDKEKESIIIEPIGYTYDLKKDQPEVAIEIPPEFYFLQPVFILSGNIKITLVDINEWNA